jgi:hypothetical protein
VASIAVEREVDGNIRLVSYSGKTPTFCVFPVFSVAVMEKCCDACGDGTKYFRRVFWRFRMTVFQRHRLALTGSRWDIRWVSGRGRDADCLCISCI